MSDEGAEPLRPVAVPEAGEKPPVPGVIVGNTGEVSLLERGELIVVEALPVPLPTVVELVASVAVVDPSVLVRVG